MGKIGKFSGMFLDSKKDIHFKWIDEDEFISKLKRLKEGKEDRPDFPEDFISSFKERD